MTTSTSVRTSSFSAEVNRYRDRAGLSTQEASEFTGIGYSTLVKMRADGEGPTYAKRGKTVIYRPKDLDAYVASQLITGRSR